MSSVGCLHIWHVVRPARGLDQHSRMSLSLAERGLRDGVGRLYASRASRRGELVQCGGAAVDIGELLAIAMQRFGPPAALAADRWREAELRDALKKAGVPRAALSLRGQGFRDGAEDVRAFSAALASRAR